VNPPAAQSPDARVAVLTPAQRLDASRARLRTALQTARGTKPPSAEGDERASDGSLFDGLWRSGRRVWASHPLRGAFRLAQQTVGPTLMAELKPLLRRHPWRIVALAAGVGAAVVWLRPWRLLPQAALGSALLSVVLPRRAIFQELMASGLLERLASGELFARWFAKAADERLDEGAPADPQHPPADAQQRSAPATAEAEVLHPAGSKADTARGP
jgi:hypothetical protein